MNCLIILKFHALKCHNNRQYNHHLFHEPHKAKSPYKCKLCPAGYPNFKNEDDFRNHLMIKHVKKSVENFVDQLYEPPSSYQYLPILNSKEITDNLGSLSNLAISRQNIRIQNQKSKVPQNIKEWSILDSSKNIKEWPILDRSNFEKYKKGDVEKLLLQHDISRKRIAPPIADPKSSKNMKFQITAKPSCSSITSREWSILDHSNFKKSDFCVENPEAIQQIKTYGKNDNPIPDQYESFTSNRKTLERISPEIDDTSDGRFCFIEGNEESSDFSNIVCLSNPNTSTSSSEESYNSDSGQSEESYNSDDSSQSEEAYKCPHCRISIPSNLPIIENYVPPHSENVPITSITPIQSPPTTPEDSQDSGGDIQCPFTNDNGNSRSRRSLLSCALNQIQNLIQTLKNGKKVKNAVVKVMQIGKKVKNAVKKVVETGKKVGNKILKSETTEKIANTVLNDLKKYMQSKAEKINKEKILQKLGEKLFKKGFKIVTNGKFEKGNQYQADLWEQYGR